MTAYQPQTNYNQGKLPNSMTYGGQTLLMAGAAAIFSIATIAGANAQTAKQSAKVATLGPLQCLNREHFTPFAYKASGYKSIDGTSKAPAGPDKETLIGFVCNQYGETFTKITVTAEGGKLKGSSAEVYSLVKAGDKLSVDLSKPIRTHAIDLSDKLFTEGELSGALAEKATWFSSRVSDYLESMQADAARGRYTFDWRNQATITGTGQNIGIKITDADNNGRYDGVEITWTGDLRHGIPTELLTGDRIALMLVGHETVGVVTLGADAKDAKVDAGTIPYALGQGAKLSDAKDHLGLTKAK